MANKFNVVRVRPHLVQERVLALQGWMYGMQPGDHVEITLDGRKLPFEMKVYDGMEVRQRYSELDLGIDKEYYLYVKLPEGFGRAAELELWVVDADGNHTHSADRKLEAAGTRQEKRRRELEQLPLYHEKASRLETLMSQVDYYIEQVVLGKGKCYIKGWAAAAEPVAIAVKDAGGRPLEGEVSRHERKDVNKVYREALSLPDCGFEVTLPHHGLSGVTLELSSGRRKTVVKVPVVSTFVSEQVIGHGIVGRGIRFFQHYGFRPFLARTMEIAMRKPSSQGDYGRFFEEMKPTQETLRKQEQEALTWEERPLCSIVVPLYKTPLKYLAKLVESVQSQSYSKWELCLSDGSGEGSPLEEYLRKLEKQEKRVKVIRNASPLRISENTNAALRAASGDIIVFADHDDMLTPDALYECVKALWGQPGADMAYSDEDKVSMNGKRYFQPHFKSDYNPDLLCSMNYFCHLVAVRKSLLDRVGGLDPAFDGAQDYDFALRCTEHTQEIRHIPKALYHWRAHENSTAENPESKRYAFEAGMRAIQAHYDRRKIPAEVVMGEYPGLYRTYYHWKEQPLVSILIPNKDHTEDLEKCIQSVAACSYSNYEVIVIENNSELPETFAYYKKLEAAYPNVHVVYWEGGFNFAAINNYGAGYAKGEYLLFLNNDTEMIRPDCLWELLGPCMRDDVGIVGARLYYEDDTIQHAGVVIGFGGIAGHTFIGFDRAANGYFSRIICAQDYSAVTAACMMTKKSVFDQVGGMTEELVVAFNDIDYCMKVRELGKLVVYNPYAELYHYESKSRGLEDSPEKQERFYKEMKWFVEKWKAVMDKGDPYYNPNLTLSKADFSLKQV
ncbi:glycosyltransferase family 2 protein [Lachnospiraceae bacterium 29-84]